MANKPLKEYDDFAGSDGYIIVDGIDTDTPGGKLKIPNYAGATDGAVLTKKTVNDADEIVWEASPKLPVLPGSDDKLYMLSCKNGVLSWAQGS
jgi:hypothetical protein